MTDYCQCHQIGGPFIAEDPDCPVHGRDGYEDRLDRAESEIARLKAEIKRLKGLAGDFCQCCVENDCDCMEGVTWGDGTDDH